MEWKPLGYGIAAFDEYDGQKFEFRIVGAPKRQGADTRVDTLVIMNGVQVSRAMLSLTDLKARAEAAKYLTEAVNEMFGKAGTGLIAFMRRRLEDIALEYETQLNRARFSIGELKGPFPDSTYEYVLEPFTCTNGGVIMFAPEGSFKSYMAMLMAQSMSQGCSTIWKTTKKKTLLINLERDEASVRARMKRVNLSLGIHENLGLHVITAPAATLQDVYDVTKRYIADNDIEYLVVDSVTRVSNDSLTDDTTANHTIRMLNDFGLGWLGIGHTPKYKPDILYGSFAFRAGVWATIKLTSKHTSQREMDIVLDFDKSNDLPKVEPQGYHAWFDNTGLTRFELNSSTNTVIASRSGPPPASEAIEEYLDTNPDSKLTDIEEGTGLSRRTVSAVLNGDGFVYSQTGNQKFWSLVR